MRSHLATTIASIALCRPCFAGDAAPPQRKLASVEVEELASYGLTLEEFEEVRASESPPDFTLESDDETNQLWSDAAVFEYEAAMSYATNYATTSVGFHPYLVCSTLPGLSGREREAAVNETFFNAGVLASQFYSEGNVFHNDEDRSCGVLRAYNDTVALVYASDPEAAAHLSVNPLHPSMKMTRNTVETLRSWFDEGVISEDVVTIGDAVASATSAAVGRMNVKQLGLYMLLCPGVQDFGDADVPDDQIADDVKNFVTDEGGKTVKDLSFYYHRVSGMDGDAAAHTVRMAEWSSAIHQVANNWTKADGSNRCLDLIIGENMLFTVEKKFLAVNAKLSVWEGIQYAESLGFSEEDLETCIWYMTYSLALSPMVCSLEPLTAVRTLCANGTSDLSKCPLEDVEDSGGDSSSSSRLELGPWRNGVALVALFISTLLGRAVL